MLYQQYNTTTTKWNIDISISLTNKGTPQPLTYLDTWIRPKKILIQF